MSAFGEIVRLSPNVSPDAVNECLGVAFHHSVLSFDATLAHMLLPASQVSYHVLIREDGFRCTLAVDRSIAWHAGASTFLGRARCNDFLLGASFAGDTYLAPLTDAQLDSATEWVRARSALYGWTLRSFVDHRQISPGRKNDLNPVEWGRLKSVLARLFA